MGPVVLGQRRVYILPTSAGLLFAGTLALLLIGSINYNLSLGYILTFLLAGIGIVSILHTWRNLARVALRPAKTRPVFAGDSARFHIVIENPGAHQRLSLAIELAGQSAVYFDVPPRDAQDVEARMPAARRGVLRPGRFRIFTVYPVGLFYAWANVELDLHCLVYARPEPGHVPLPPAQAASGQGGASGIGEEDFVGLRTYRPGDSPRRIAWKVFARTDVFLTKEFSGSAASEWWLNLADIPEMQGREARLSRLTRWVIEAETAGQRFGLRLPGTEFEPEFGASHRDRCLHAIALYKPAHG
jgi:uncharacterized protein (DUF58 family)